MIWLVFGAIAVTGFIVLFFGRAGKGVAVDPVAHYKAQLLEIDADLERGMIDPESAKAAQLEVKRRLLRAVDGDENPKANRLSTGDQTGFAVITYGAAVAALVIFSGLLYGLMGSPNTPSAPPPPREVAKDRLIEEGGDITFGQAIEKFKDHLATNPDDMQGWQYLATTARAVGDYSTAATAYGELARVNPTDPNLRIEEFEAYMAHGDGRVTPAARLVLAAFLDVAPDHPAGQYYLGVTYMQAGNEDGARAVWTALADRSTADAPWMPALQRQLSALGVKPPQLSEEDIAVVNNMNDSEREEFLSSMLARLESKLESDPSDPNGWLMLARSKLTLGDKSGAISALKSGISANPGEKSAELQAFLDNIEQSPKP